MAVNKNAMLRYQVLDKCFRNTGKRYYINDLIEACNKALLEYSPDSDGIKKRQLYEDIRFMESSQGWSIPLDRVKEGRRSYFQYKLAEKTDYFFSFVSAVYDVEKDFWMESSSAPERFSPR